MLYVSEMAVPNNIAKNTLGKGFDKLKVFFVNIEKCFISPFNM